MIGVIIAAGSGTRMAPLTDNRPKCMLSVGGRPLIEPLAENLRRIGCSRIVVVVISGLSVSYLIIVRVNTKATEEDVMEILAEPHQRIA